MRWQIKTFNAAARTLPVAVDQVDADVNAWLLENEAQLAGWIPKAETLQQPLATPEGCPPLFLYTRIITLSVEWKQAASQSAVWVHTGTGEQYG